MYASKAVLQDLKGIADAALRHSLTCYASVGFHSLDINFKNDLGNINIKYEYFKSVTC